MAKSIRLAGRSLPSGNCRRPDASHRHLAQPAVSRRMFPDRRGSCSGPPVRKEELRFASKQSSDHR